MLKLNAYSGISLLASLLCWNDSTSRAQSLGPPLDAGQAQALPSSNGPGGTVVAQAQLSAAQRLTFAKALNRGRTLAQKNDLPGAATAFREALQIAPNHVAALSELSLVLLQQKDLPHAEAAARGAIEHAGPDRAKSASYYDGRRLSGNAEVREFALRDLIGGNKGLVLRLHAASGTTELGGRETYQGEEYLTIVGVGKSARPHCTPPILLSRIAADAQDRPGSNLFQKEGASEGIMDVSQAENKQGGALRYRFLPDGQFELQGPFNVLGAGLARREIGALLGKHWLLFP